MKLLYVLRRFIRIFRLHCYIIIIIIIIIINIISWSQSQQMHILVLQSATRIKLQPNHTETPTHVEPRTIRPMW